jgi:hypothetical protein
MRQAQADVLTHHYRILGGKHTKNMSNSVDKIEAGFYGSKFSTIRFRSRSHRAQFLFRALQQESYLFPGQP